MTSGICKFTMALDCSILSIIWIIIEAKNRITGRDAIGILLSGVELVYWTLADLAIKECKASLGKRK